jgi:SAM-dependent methyltransferase
VKQVEKLSVTYRYKTRDVVKNYDAVEASSLIQNYLTDGFTSANLFTTEFDLQLNNGKVKKTAATQQAPASLEHDRTKQRPITAEGKSYLHALNITDAKGKVHPTAQDKYRQINKYIEILSGLVTKQDGLRVVDMGAGKGYLTFALYDYLVNTLGIKPSVVGVEYREELVKLCNIIAADAGFDGLQFVQGAIDNYDSSGVNLLIALHACDTATDDAIAKGIHAKADTIVVAPCCHKQIRKDMEAATPAPTLEFLLKHGTLMERQAEMVTDGLRALLLELHGYRTKVFEFISDAHTPKNVMITATRGELPSPKRRAALEQEIAAAKAQFGIRRHYLETLLA